MERREERRGKMKERNGVDRTGGRGNIKRRKRKEEKDEGKEWRRRRRKVTRRERGRGEGGRIKDLV